MRDAYFKIKDETQKEMTRIIKVLLPLLFAFGINSLSMAQVSQNEADAIVGTWLMPDNEGVIEIIKDGEYYHGKIVWMQEKEEDGTPLKDKENPVDSLKTRTVEGLQIMSNFKFEGDDIWSGGTFYAAKKGMKVEPDFILEDEDHLNLEISFFIFSKTVNLTRIDNAQQFQSTNKEVK